jgi:bifunctional oligoribonuclease and PAP phosphatase NrnA
MSGHKTQMSKTSPQHEKESVDKLKGAIERSQHILIMQADMPDGDSLSTALALEEILGDLGKQVSLYSYNQPPEHLRYLEGWDRVAQEPPEQYDLGILVDASGPEMLQASLEHFSPQLTRSPWLLIDHHPPSTNAFPLAVTAHTDPHAASTAEMVVRLAQTLNWPISATAANKLAVGILSDSLGLTTPTTSLDTVLALAELVRLGANLNQLNILRRELGALTPELISHKGQLLSRIEYFCNQRLAVCVINPDEARQTKSHNPTDLVMSEMHWIKGVELAAVLKHYGTKTKIIMRARKPIAGAIATKFGGGGHAHAASYRTDNQSVEDTKQQLIDAYTEVTGAPN